MNFFDYLHFLNPILYGVAKFITDLNRDEKTTSPLREWFVKLKLGKEWDDPQGGYDGQADVWHRADVSKTVIAFGLELVAFHYSHLPLVLQMAGGIVVMPFLGVPAWLLPVVVLLLVMGVKLYLLHAVFLLGYKHVFASKPAPWKLWLMWLVWPFKTINRSYES